MPEQRTNSGVQCSSPHAAQAGLAASRQDETQCSYTQPESFAKHPLQPADSCVLLPTQSCMHLSPSSEEFMKCLMQWSYQAAPGAPSKMHACWTAEMFAFTAPSHRA
jgi:hypothetical protein